MDINNCIDPSVRDDSAAEPGLRTPEDIALELLKIGVTNPELYDSLQKVFTEHQHPDKLDPVGKLIRDFFVNIRS